MPIKQLLKVGAKGADDLIHTAKKLEIRRPVKPKLDTAEGQFFIDDFLKSQTGGKGYSKNRLIQDDGQSYFIERDGSSKTGFKWRNESNKYANVAAQGGRRADEALAQTKVGRSQDDFLTKYPDEINEPGTKYEMHHIAGLARSRYLYEGLPKKQQQALTRYLEQYYGIFMGNHRGNAAKLPDDVHLSLHNWMKEHGYIERDGTLKGLSLKDRKDYIKEFAEEQQRIQEYMYHLMGQR